MYADAGYRYKPDKELVVNPEPSFRIGEPNLLP